MGSNMGSNEISLTQPLYKFSLDKFQNIICLSSCFQDVFPGVPGGGGQVGHPVAAGRGGHGLVPLARPPLHPHLRLRVLPQVQGDAAQGVPQGPQDGATTIGGGGRDTREEARFHRLGWNATQQVSPIAFLSFFTKYQIV